ncbi:MAG: SGNH/GDSL hydrolase family protein [Micromonosporaceae bacterium]
MKRFVTRKRVILTVCLLLASVLGIAGTAGYLAFVRGPENPPADACKGRPAESARPAVVAAGASITQGTLGGSWVEGLRAKPEFSGYEFVNAGVNGNTSADLRRRVDTDVVACHPAAVMILVGTNDVRSGVPVPEYLDNLAAIVDRIKTGAGARVALMSLPPLGEDLGAEMNRTLAGYNAAIKDLAARAKVGYVPVYERMAEILGRQGERPAYDFSFALSLWTATQHYVFGLDWDDIARGGGRELLIDHIHLSDRGAAEVRELSAGWLKETAREDRG